jgi:predicted acyltransferase
MQKRYLSLDVFRGFTVALMILVNNPGSFSNIFWPLDHASWNGCTLADLVFPFFLFAVGNSAAFVLPTLKVASSNAYFKKIIKRSIYIFLIGLFLNWFPFFKWDGDHLIFKDWHDVRILGVLQRIAICYLLAAALIFIFDVKNLIFIGAFLLFAYWFFCFKLGGIHPYNLDGFFGTKIDSIILGENHMYKGEGIAFEPEGLISSIAAIVQILIGYLIGLLIIQKGKSFEMLSDIFVIGVFLVIIGLFWNLAFPINKKIWTSSYTIFTSGVAILFLGCLIYAIELKQHKFYLSNFFEIFGKNPLFIFVLSGLIPRLLALIKIPFTDATGKATVISPLKYLYEFLFKNISADFRIGSLIYSILFLGFFWLVGYYLDRKKIYVKL